MTTFILIQLNQSSNYFNSNKIVIKLTEYQLIAEKNHIVKQIS